MKHQLVHTLQNKNMKHQLVPANTNQLKPISHILGLLFLVIFHQSVLSSELDHLLPPIYTGKLQVILSSENKQNENDIHLWFLKKHVTLGNKYPNQALLLTYVEILLDQCRAQRASSRAMSYL
jgi:hypothetical protein